MLQGDESAVGFDAAHRSTRIAYPADERQIACGFEVTRPDERREDEGLADDLGRMLGLFREGEEAAGLAAVFAR